MITLIIPRNKNLHLLHDSSLMLFESYPLHRSKVSYTEKLLHLVQTIFEPNYILIQEDKWHVILHVSFNVEYFILSDMLVIINEYLFLLEKCHSPPTLPTLSNSCLIDGEWSSSSHVVLILQRYIYSSTTMERIINWKRYMIHF